MPVVLTGSHYTTSVDDVAAGRRYEHLHFDTSSMAHFRAIETFVGGRRRGAGAVRLRIAVPGDPVVDQRDPRREHPGRRQAGDPGRQRGPALRPAGRRRRRCPRSSGRPRAYRRPYPRRADAVGRPVPRRRRAHADARGGQRDRSRGRVERAGHRGRPRGRQPRDGRGCARGSRASSATWWPTRTTSTRRASCSAAGATRPASSGSRSTASGRTGTPAARRSRRCSTSSRTTAGRSRSTTTGRTGTSTCCGSRATIRACRSSSPTPASGHPNVEGARIAAEADNIYAEMCSSFAQIPAVREFIRTIPAERMLFGTDAPLLDPAFVLGTYQDAEIPAGRPGPASTGTTPRGCSGSADLGPDAASTGPVQPSARRGRSAASSTRAPGS